MPPAPSKTFRFLLAVVVVASCIGCDQATKRIATETLRNAPRQSYLGDTIRLEYAQNRGGFLSLGNNLPDSVRSLIFIGITSVFMLVVAGLMVRRWDVSLVVFLSGAFILAGGIGNLIDRATQNGLVTDFLNVGIGPLRTGIFNVADMAVTFGTIAFIIATRGRLDPKPDCVSADS